MDKVANEVEDNLLADFVSFLVRYTEYLRFFCLFFLENKEWRVFDYYGFTIFHVWMIVFG